MKATHCVQNESDDHAQGFCLMGKSAMMARSEKKDTDSTIRCDDTTDGDYFDYHDLSDGKLAKLGVAIGDVSGHGISAALLMASVRAALRMRVTMGGDLQDIVFDVNRQLVSDVETSGLFISLFI